MNTSSNHHEINGDHYYIFNSFRAWLHTVITAEQFGHTKRLPALPGSQTENYCLTLAKLPGNELAAELARPVSAILGQIDRATMYFQRRMCDESAAAKHEQYEKILWQLDFALALILNRLSILARYRAKRTQCPDLLCAVVSGIIDHGPDAVNLLHRYKQLYPDEFHPSENVRADGDPVGRVPPPGATPLIQSPAAQRDTSDPFADFAWDTYQRVEALDRLADEVPASLRTAARQMHGWPMLVHRHNGNQKRAQELATRLELGLDYPLDASETARFRPDTPMVRYLDAWVYKIEYVRRQTANASYESPEKERETLRQWWREGQDERPGDDVVEIVRAVPKLPPLTKTTAREWAEKAIVPLIMVTDARDWENCEEPALQPIAKQAGVKSEATFKSRLLAAVSSSLRRLARPDQTRMNNRSID